MKMKHLLATAGSLEGIENCVARFFGGERKNLSPAGPNMWLICRPAGTPIDGMQVRKVGKRYRLEME